LKRAGVATVRDILDLGPKKLKEVRNLGIKCYREIVGILKALGVNVDGYDI
jgi:DNA-directed RNA polymerase alpha subunit